MDLENQDQLQNELKNLENKQENIEKLLDRGSESIVLQLGTHSIRYGIANDSNPMTIENAIAFKIDKENEKEEIEKNVNFDKLNLDEFYVFYNNLLETGKIKKKNRTIIKSNKYDENEKIYELEKNVLENQDKNIYFGNEALLLSENENYVVRKPIKNGNFNISKNYSENQIINDLELILAYIFEVLIGIDIGLQKNYYLILTVTDEFDRFQYENFLDTIIKRFYFKGISLHQETILTSFCNNNLTSLVIDISLKQTKIAITDEGNIVPNSKVIINFGIEDIDYLIFKFLLNEGYFMIFEDEEITYNHEMNNFISFLREKIGYFYKLNDSEEYFLVKFKNKVIKLFKGDIISCINSIFCNFESLKKPSLEVSILDILKNNKELKHKAVENIIFTGGLSNLEGLNFELEDRLINYISIINDDIEKVHMINLWEEVDIMNFDTIWCGASIIPKLDNFLDYVIMRNKYLGLNNNDFKREKNRIIGKDLIKEKVPFIW